MSKIKLALDIVNDLKSLANSIETLVTALEGHDSVKPQESNSVNIQKDESQSVETEDPAFAEQQQDAMAAARQPALEEVRAAMADKSRDGHREAVKNILNKYGVNNLSALDPKHYADTIKEVGELK